jgi:glycosyltransferase involved in cell wall biosynthesis
MPKFSIVIPTLQRASTFQHALATAREQTFDDYEIVVQNNGNDPATSAIVERCADARIRHFSSNDVLTMARNWEAALDNATGDYITFIGDDDGLFPEACKLADYAIKATGLEIISWVVGSTYYWPGYLHAELSNRLLATIDYDCRIDLIQSEKELRSVYQFAIGYWRLPMIYNSFVHRSVIRRVKAAAGQYFLGYAPDVFSGIANAAFTDRFARLTPPLSLTGTSKHSTGHNHFASAPGYSTAEQTNRDFGTFSFHEQLVPSDTLEMFIANDMLTAKERLFPRRRIEFSYELLVAHLAANINDRPGFYHQTLAALGQLATRHNVDMKQIAVPVEVAHTIPRKSGGMHDHGQRIDFVANGDDIGLRNIHDAVRLLEQLRPTIEPLNRLEIRSASGREFASARSGQTLSFGLYGNGLEALQDGWGDSEPWGTWTIAKKASLAFTFADPPTETTILIVSLRSLVAPGHPNVQATFSAGNQTVAQWTGSPTAWTGDTVLSIPPSAITPDGCLVIQIAILEPVSPAQLGLGSDTRLLGVGIEKIAFKTGSEVAPVDPEA